MSLRLAICRGKGRAGVDGELSHGGRQRPTSALCALDTCVGGRGLCLKTGQHLSSAHVFSGGLSHLSGPHGEDSLFFQRRSVFWTTGQVNSGLLLGFSGISIYIHTKSDQQPGVPVSQGPMCPRHPGSFPWSCWREAWQLSALCVQQA